MASRRPLTAAWTFAPDAALSERPEGGRITVAYPYNTITYRYDRPTNTYTRSVSGEGKQLDPADDNVRIAPKNVVVMVMRFGALNDGTNKQRLEAEVVGVGDGLDLDERPDDQGHVEQGGHDRSPPSSSTGTATR